MCIAWSSLSPGIGGSLRVKHAVEARQRSSSARPTALKSRKSLVAPAHAQCQVRLRSWVEPTSRDERIPRWPRGQPAGAAARPPDSPDGCAQDHLGTPPQERQSYPRTSNFCDPMTESLLCGCSGMRTTGAGGSGPFAPGAGEDSPFPSAAAIHIPPRRHAGEQMINADGSSTSTTARRMSFGDAFRDSKGQSVSSTRSTTMCGGPSIDGYGRSMVVPRFVRLTGTRNTGRDGERPIGATVTRHCLSVPPSRSSSSSSVG